MIDGEPPEVQYLEQIKWHTGKVADTALRAANLFARYTGSESTRAFFHRNRLLPAIETQSTLPVSVVALNGEGYDLLFRWPGPTAINGRQITTWHHEEPYIQFVDRSYGVLLPSDRSFLFRQASAIAKELEEVNYLVVTETPILTMRFPKGIYARSVGTGLATATLLDNIANRNN